LRASITDSLFLGEKRVLLLNVDGAVEPLRAQVVTGADAPPIGPTTTVYVRRADILKLNN
jgi:hypothetical protein